LKIFFWELYLISGNKKIDSHKLQAFITVLKLMPIFHQIENPDLLEHINRAGIQFYEK